jgi:hypothetical protein
VDVGFKTDHLLLAAINPPQNRYPTGKDTELYERLEKAITAVPGVESVAATWVPYISDSKSATDFLPEGERYDKNKHQSEDFNIVGNQFFATLGIPMVAGRAFTAQDTQTSPKVAVINQSLARSRFPNQNPDCWRMWRYALLQSAQRASAAVLFTLRAEGHLRRYDLCHSHTNEAGRSLACPATRGATGRS